MYNWTTTTPAQREALPCPSGPEEQKKRNSTYVKREGACLQDMQALIFSSYMFHAAGETRRKAQWLSNGLTTELQLQFQYCWAAVSGKLCWDANQTRNSLTACYLVPKDKKQASLPFRGLGSTKGQCSSPPVLELTLCLHTDLLDWWSDCLFSNRSSKWRKRTPLIWSKPMD